jgi:hypothetical protein
MCMRRVKYWERTAIWDIEVNSFSHVETPFFLQVEKNGRNEG